MGDGDRNFRNLTYLRVLYLERIERNPKYSLRSFAKQLEIPSGRLSELLSGKRRLTLSLVKKIAARLKLDEGQRSALLREVIGTSMPALAANPRARLVLDEERFAVIADPIHFTILSLMRTADFRTDEQWIAKRLKSSPAEVRRALNRLKDLGVLRLAKGNWARTEQSLGTSDGPSSAALRISHRRSLEQAMSTIDGVAAELRDLFSITLAIDPRKLPQARARIRSFAESLEAFLEEGDRTEVYNLNIQLVPLSGRPDETK